MLWLRGIIGASARSWLGQGFQAILDYGPSVNTAAGYAYDTALTMCGNEGQVSIIEQMGFGAFKEAAEYALGGDDAVDVLEGLCSHPEAVSEILAEAGQIINDVMGEVAEANEEAEEEGF